MNITSLIDDDDSLKSEENWFVSVEKVILRWDPSLEGSRRSLNWEDLGDEADEYLSTIDEILNLMDELSIWSDSKNVDQAYSAIQHTMSQLGDEFFVSIYLSTTVRSCSVSLSPFFFLAIILS